MKMRSLRMLSVGLSLALFPFLAQAAKLVATWDANSEPDLGGYRLYWGTASRGAATNSAQFSYETNTVVGVAGTPSNVVASLDSDTVYYFSVTAFDTNNNESVFSDEVKAATVAVKVDTGGEWKYVKGTAEASSPPTAWRMLNFDDSAWGTAGDAPFGYSTSPSEGPFGTTLTDMTNFPYTTVFLRKTFTVANPPLVNRLLLNGVYDDGFILWINGNEVVRVNMTNEPAYIPFDHRTAPLGSIEPTNWSVQVTAEALPPLSPTNVLAVQAFNYQTNSSDFKIDMALSVVQQSLIVDTDDADGDGLRDTWETTYHGSTNQDGTADSDGDGISDLHEFIGGSDPTNGASVLAVDIDPAAGGGSRVIAFAAPDATGTGYGTRRFSLEYSTELKNGTWQGVPGYTNIQGAGQMVAFTNAAGAETVYYRVKAWLEE
ncbi:MAG: hypothetical protein JXR37_31225 [Kiritimatiellae bacterium]|nr:hypothetical protein [Kiritimatiellia bacterium]